MAERLVKNADFGEYTPYRFNAATSDQLVEASHTHGTFFGYVTVGTLGTTPVITLGNGTTGTTGNIIGKLTPLAPGTFTFLCTCDKGLYIAITGSGFDITVSALAMAI